MTDVSRIRHRGAASKIMTAEQAATLIAPGDRVGMSGFTGAGLPQGGAGRTCRAHGGATATGDPLQVGVWTGASTAPELDGALAEADGIDLRMPYQSDPIDPREDQRAA